MKKLVIVFIVVIVATLLNSCIKSEDSCGGCENGVLPKLILRDASGKTKSVLKIDSIEYIVDNEVSRFEVTNFTNFSALNADTANALKVAAFRVYNGAGWSNYNPIGCVFFTCDGKTLNVDDGLIIYDNNNVLWLSSDDWVVTRHFIAVGNPSDSVYGAWLNAQSWTKDATGVPNQILRDVASNGTYYAIVGTGGVVLTSFLGDNNWIQRNSGVYSNLFGITYGNGQYVAVGDNGTIITSPDGIVWTSRLSNTSLSLLRVTYGGNKFVAITNNGNVVLTSENGIVWEQKPLGAVYDLKDIIYGNGKYVAVGFYNCVLTSPDGAVWTKQTSASIQGNLRGIAYGDGKFVAIEQGFALISTDGINWSLHSTANSIPHGALQDIIYGFGTYGNGSFVAVGSNGAIVTSPDGISWTTEAPSVTNNFLNAVGTL